MKKFEFKVRVQANSEEHAKRILQALFDIKKAVSEEDLIKIARLIKKKPHLIKKIQAFI